MREVDFIDSFTSATPPDIGAVVEDNSIDGDKILLDNNQTLNAKSQDGLSEIPIVKVNTSNQVEVNTKFLYTTAPTLANEVVNKNYVDTNKQDVSQKGAANGYAPLNSSAQIDSVYLPSFVDDVLEYANEAAFPVTGETGKIYVAIDTGLTYRWSGSVYIKIGQEVTQIELDTAIAQANLNSIINALVFG